MRRFPNTPFLILALAALGLLSARTPARAQTGHSRALLIGISTYDAYNKSGLFPNLDCAEDLTRIQAALVSTFHFDPTPAAGQITVLSTPEQTTRAAILAAMETLIQQTGAGDVVYIHYSGHGSQVPDATSPGGLDDTIVPADYKDDQSNEIKGKELAALLKRLKAKRPAQIALSFDCCHSATITRGEAKKRGLSWAEYVQWYQGKYGAVPARPAGARGANARPENVAVADLDQSGYVVLSACSNSSCAFETQDQDGNSLGRLSDVLADVLARATPQTTYQQVYDQVNATFKQKFPDQDPQIDGDPNTTLLGGQADPPRPSIPVAVASPGQYTLDAGKLQGMSAGSTFAIYAKNATTFTPQTQIANATLGDVGLTSSTLTVSKKVKADLTDDDLSAAHAVETVHDYGAFQMTLDADSVRQAMPDQATAVLAALTNAGMVSTDVPAGQTADVKAVRLPAGPARGVAPVGLVRVDTGAPIVTLNPTGDLPRLFANALERQARYRYATTVLNRQDPDSSVQVKLRLVPALVGKNSDGVDVWKADAPVDPQNTTHTFHLGDHFTIEARNPGDEDIFLAVLDIDSDGSIGQAWPSKSHIAEDNILPKGQADRWVKLWAGSDVTQPALFHVTTADPNELFKAIATDTYVSFKAIVDRDMTRAPKGPFDALLGPAAGLPANRGVEEDQAPASWATDTYAFRAVGAGTTDTGRGITAMSK